MTSRHQKKLDSIQRLFLLYITGAYRTTPTAVLQVVTGLQPLHLQIQQEAAYDRVARAKSSSIFFTVIFSPTDYESKISGIHIHPLIFFSTIKFHLQKITRTQEPRLYILMDLKRTKTLVAHIAFLKTID
ncbi:hypothetical protein AVEN_63804-1 [Araneus ventricosus]|uniref:Uncharacterized protein n=1 Tax=Araneus ventricosus TaxID=182803 RepID=A0A4Y2LUL0_ARAVE|nr:hypothetical protein AVEN_63804-1 [Araneus ventricosus]